MKYFLVSCHNRTWSDETEQRWWHPVWSGMHQC